MLQYEIATGRIKGIDDDSLIGIGYSGLGPGKDNYDMVNVPDVGPIPPGVYTIGKPFDSDTHGPFVMQLTPSADTNTYGRAGFLIHGDSKEYPGAASHGCIVASRPVRMRMSQDTVIKVITKEIANG